MSYRQKADGTLELVHRRFPHEGWEVEEENWQKYFVPNLNSKSVYDLCQMWDGFLSLGDSYVRLLQGEE